MTGQRGRKPALLPDQDGYGRGRYWMASARWAGCISGAAARSAVGRPRLTLHVWWKACMHGVASCCMAERTSCFPALSSQQ